MIYYIMLVVKIARWKMKHIFLCLTLLLIITGCTSKNPVNTEGKKSYTEINYVEYQSKISHEEDFALYIGSANCGYCKNLNPILENVIHTYDLEVSYIDSSKLTKEDATTLWEETSIGGTPTIVFVSKGKIKLFPRIEGAVPENVLIEKFKSAGYIK